MSTSMAPDSDNISSSLVSPQSPPELPHRYRTHEGIPDIRNDDPNDSTRTRSNSSRTVRTSNTTASSSSPSPPPAPSHIGTPSSSAAASAALTSTTSSTSTTTASSSRSNPTTPTRMAITSILSNPNDVTHINNHHHYHQNGSHNNHNHAAVVMERVVFQIHYRMCCTICNWVPANVRQFLEHSFLVLSVLGFSALVLLHKSFVFTDPSNHNIAMTCFQDIISNSTTTTSLGTIDLLYINILKDDRSGSSVGSENFKTKTTLLPTTPKHLENTRGPTSTETGASDTCLYVNANDTSSSPSQCARQQSSRIDQPQDSSSYEYQYIFSTTQAYLLIPEDHSFLGHGQKNLNIVHISVSTKDANCFGEPFLQSMLWHCWIDLDILVQNWCLGMLSQLQQKQPASATTNNLPIGYLWKSTQQANLQELATSPDGNGGIGRSSNSHRHRKTDKDYTEIMKSMMHLLVGKISRWIQITFLFFFCTTLVSFTLTETQERMLWFTHELRRRVQSNVPVRTLVVGHLIQTFVFVPIMVGMIFFLMECYQGDKVLAFLQLSIVWCVEVFSVLSLRSYQGMKFFPKIFFLLFCLFHVYHFANPHGFGYFALTVIACFMGHSMFFFWNRYELPAVARELVTVDRPRRLLGGPSLSAAARTTTMETSSSPASSAGLISPSSFFASTPGDGQQHAAHVAGERGPITPTSISGGEIIATTMATPLRNNSSRSSLPPVVNTAAIFRMDPSAHQPHVGGGHGRGEPTQGFGTTASVASLSSHRTNSGVFQAGASVEGDEEDSFVYFMEGEVVLRRNRRPRPGSDNNSHGSNVADTNPVGGTISFGGTLSNNTPIDACALNHNKPTNNNPMVGLDVDGDDADESQRQENRPPLHPMAIDRNGMSSPTATRAPYSDESGGLQAILEMRLTPQRRQEGNSTAVEQSDGTSLTTSTATTSSTLAACSRDRSPPPIFPILP